LQNYGNIFNLHIFWEGGGGGGVWVKVIPGIALQELIDKLRPVSMISLNIIVIND
jgi:hypothetical protein